MMIEAKIAKKIQSIIKYKAALVLVYDVSFLCRDSTRKATHKLVSGEMSKLYDYGIDS